MLKTTEFVAILCFSLIAGGCGGTPGPETGSASQRALGVWKLDYEKYPWDPAVYQVTRTSPTALPKFYHLTLAEYVADGSPHVITVYSMFGDSVFRYHTNASELFHRPPPHGGAPVNDHHLTRAEWDRMGDPTPTVSSTGFYKAIGSTAIYLINCPTTRYHLGADEWASYAQPTPVSVWTIPNCT